MSIGEPACSYAALILPDEQIPVTPEKIATLVKADNIPGQSYCPSLFAKLCDKNNMQDLITNVGSAAVAVDAPVGGGAAEEKTDDTKEESDEPYLPEHIIFSILIRLPVKSILRFKCVTKQWLSLFSSPYFISIHRQEISKNPVNNSFIARVADEDYHVLENNIYGLYVIYTEREPVSLFTPSRWMSEGMKLVGSINGLVCLAAPLGDTAILWNPAMNLFKTIRLSTPRLFTLGFAYDSVSDDYKIIWIEDEDFDRSSFCPRAGVYSASLDSWKIVQIDFNVSSFSYECNVIAKGIPYWSGFMINNEGWNVLVYYDMRNGLFKHVLRPFEDFGFVEWKGNLGRIESRGDFVDIWVYDETGVCWNKISSHGPTGLNMCTAVQCSRDGVILGECEGEQLMLYDTVTNRSKKLSIPGADIDYVEAVSYTESLVTIKGMEKVKEQEKDKS